MKKLRLLLLSSSIISAMVLSSIVLAKDQQEGDDSSIEKIEVIGQQSYYDEEAYTATRIDLANIETPQSIFVINSDLIADQQAFRFDQILQNDSSVQKSNNFLGAYSSYSIRGFTLSNGSNYLRDGRAFFHLANVPTEGLERVEVLKGPSSVLYGTMTPGGLINMIPKRPKPESHTSIKGTLGSYDFYHAALDAGGSVTSDGSLRYRVAGAYESSNSFRQFVDGSDFNTKRKIVAVALDWDASDSTTVRFNYDYTADDRPQDIGVVSPNGDFSKVNYDLIYNQPWSHYNSDVANYFVEINHEISEAFKIRAGYSYVDYERDRFDNQLRGRPSAEGDVKVRARRRINRRDYQTYYADLLIDFETGPLKHQMLLGIDKTEIETDNNETAKNIVFQTNIHRPEIIPNPNIQTRPQKNLGEETREGITFHDVISTGEHWRVLIGGRYDDFTSTFTSFGAAQPRIFGEADGHFTPRAGALYLPQPNVSFYLSYSESFEPNSPVGSGFDNQGQKLEPTLGEQLEAGVKWEALNERLFVTGALFSIERTGAPFENVTTNRIEQRGTQEHKGLEFSVTGLVSNEITLNGSATILDAEFTQDNNQSLIGNTPYGVADVSLAFTAEYEFLKGNLRGLSLQGSIFYESSRPVDNANTYDLDAYTRVDISAKYVQETSSGLDLIYRLSALNLTNEEYYKGRSPLALNPELPFMVRASVEVLF